MAELISSILGYAGAALIISAYFFNQNGKLRSEDWRFPALNLCGAVLLLVSLTFSPNLPSVVIEVFWASISIFGIWKSLRTAGRARV